MFDKFFKLPIMLFLCFIIPALYIYAGEMSYADRNLSSAYGTSEFSQKAKWMTLDSAADFTGMQVLEYSAQHLTLQNPFFDTFDYMPDTENRLISEETVTNLVFIKSSEDVCINIRYEDAFNNEISPDYPKLYYKKEGSDDAYTEISMLSSVNDFFKTSFSAETGKYEYYVTASNSKYPGEYKSRIANFVVTERPHSFKNLNLNLQDGKGNAETNIRFEWSAEKGLESDILTYTMYIGTDPENMQPYPSQTVSSYVVPRLLPRTRYYWKVEVENQHGAGLTDPPVFSFVTLGAVARAYNAPNPFNPQRGEKTGIFFEMPADGYAGIDIYSEYGDKIRHISADNLPAGTNQIMYDGKDDYGNILYNGTYICVIKKKYNGHSQTEKCRLLIIK